MVRHKVRFRLRVRVRVSVRLRFRVRVRVKKIMCMNFMKCFCVKYTCLSLQR